MNKNLDDIATKLPQIEFKQKKNDKDIYNQKMQSERGGREFVLRTYPPDSNNEIKIVLLEMFKTSRYWQEYFIAKRTAVFDDTESIHKAIKSLERKAGCKLYYVLLISTDGEYL